MSVANCEGQVASKTVQRANLVSIQQETYLISSPRELPRLSGIP